MADLTLADLRVRTVRVPLTHPHQTASGTITESPLVLLDAIASDGSVGRAIVFTYTAAALKATAEFASALAPLVVGQPLAPTAIADQLAARFRLLGTQGLVGMALAGLDMALWDALARSSEQRLIDVLGATARPIPAYGAVGYDGETGSARVAEAWAKRGFLGVKAKIGYPTVAEDLAVVRAIRAAIGPARAIMVDYNQSLSPTDAAERLRALDGEGLTWIEEPTWSHDFTGHARITHAIATPIQAGENWWGPLDFRQAIDAGASDYLMPDVMKVGGVTGWMRVAGLAHAHHLRLSSHLWPELSAQLLAASPTGHWLEYCDWWHPILQQPVTVVDGYARVDDARGSGIEWDEAAIERFRA